jgi:23S rRNA (uracil1939-C5)-methyltransferase
LAQLDTVDRAKISVFPGPAGAAVDAVAAAGGAAADAQVVIADPPRKGLDTELREYLGAQPPERFLYVSCGLESLTEDCARLTADGGLRLAGLTAFNLMPFTGHVETVARFERA